MATEKTDDDIRLEDEAHEISLTLVGTGISVEGGGRNGPFTLIVERLSREELDAVIDAVREALGC